MAGEEPEQPTTTEPPDEASEFVDTTAPPMDMAGEAVLPGVEDEVAVDLPPVPDASVEAPAVIEKLALEGSSEEAMTRFVDAPASQMAATAPDLGGALDRKTAKEKREAADSAPVLRARTVGEVDPGITPADQIPIPADVTLADKGRGPEVGELTAEPYQATGSAPDTSRTRDEIARQSSGGGFLDWIRNQFGNILNGCAPKGDALRPARANCCFIQSTVLSTRCASTNSARRTISS